MKYGFRKYRNHYLKIILILFIFTLFRFIIYISSKKIKKKIGVIGAVHEVNIGNNLIKYSISTILSKLGFEPYIIGTHLKGFNISFINKTTNLRIIKNNFSEINERDYDILMVNSDQTWRKWDSNFYDYGFLKFAKNWRIPKFIYGASLGFEYWALTKEDEEIIKPLLKQFSGISIREKNSIKLIKKHLEIEPSFVLDPTFLIEKKYYLKFIQNYNGKLNNNINYIFTYTLTKIDNMIKSIKDARKNFNYKLYNFYLINSSNIEDFIYGIFNCKAVITDSFHGTIFSIIFNKPFISYLSKDSAKERFYSLADLLGFRNRIFEYNQKANISLLVEPLKNNDNLLKKLKIKSINYIKKNLNVK